MILVTLYSDVEIRHPSPHGIWKYESCISFEVLGKALVGHPCNNKSHPFHLRPRSEAEVVKYSRTKTLDLPNDLEGAAILFAKSLDECGSLLKPSAIGKSQRQMTAIDAQFALWFSGIILSG